MKKIILLFCLAAMAACSKEELPMNITPDGVSAEVSFSVRDSGPQTKSGGFTDVYSFEKTVNTVSYFIFDDHGRLELAVTRENTSSFTERILVGEKTIYAIVNIDASKFSGISTLSAFESLETSFSDMSRDAFSMSGKVTRTITEGQNSVVVPVERYVARIHVAEIRNSLSGNLEGEDIEIRNIYVTNVVGNCLVNGSFPSVPVWYNRFGRADGASSATAYINCYDDSELGILAVSEEGYYLCWDDTYEACTPLYFFPNNATSDVNGWSSSFSKRYTRVVVEAYIRDELYFYPVSIIGAKRNHSYTLYLDITRAGSKDPDTFIWSEIQDVAFTIGGFDEWDDDFVITY